MKIFNKRRSTVFYFIFSQCLNINIIQKQINMFSNNQSMKICFINKDKQVKFRKSFHNPGINEHSQIFPIIPKTVRRLVVFVQQVRVFCLKLIQDDNLNFPLIRNTSGHTCNCVSFILFVNSTLLSHSHMLSVKSMLENWAYVVFKVR